MAEHCRVLCFPGAVSVFWFLGAEVAFSASIISLVLAQPAPDKLGATWRYPVLLITGYGTDAFPRCVSCPPSPADFGISMVDLEDAGLTILATSYFSVYHGHGSVERRCRFSIFVSPFWPVFGCDYFQ